jgi:hypothetical protein
VVREVILVVELELVCILLMGGTYWWSWTRPMHW